MQKRIDYAIKTIQGLGVGTFTIFGVIGVTLYGMSVLMVLLGIQFFLGFIIDLPMGLYIARRNNVVNSNIMGDGLISKCVAMAFSGIMLLVAGHIANSSANEYFIGGCSIAVFFIIIFFIYKELVSIVENNIIIADESSKPFWKLLAKVLGIGLVLAQTKIAKKVEKILPAGMKAEDVIEKDVPKDVV